MHKHIPPAFFEDEMTHLIVQNRYKDAAGMFSGDAKAYYIIGAPSEFDYKAMNDKEQAIIESESMNVGSYPVLRIDPTLQPAQKFHKGYAPRIRHRDPFGPETTSPPFYDHDWDPHPNIIINPVPDFEKHYDDYNIHPSQNPDFGMSGVEIIGRRFERPRQASHWDPQYEVSHSERLKSLGLGRATNPSDRGTSEVPSLPPMLKAPTVNMKAPDDFPIDRKGKRLPDF